MNPVNHKKRTIIIVSTILLLALIGLVFIQSDYVAADQNSAMEQTTPADFDSGASVFPSLMRILSALVLVIGAIYGGIFLLKKMMGGRYTGTKSNGNLEVLETIHLSPKKSVTLLRVGEKSVLVGSTDSGMSLLSELSEEETSKVLDSVETAPAAESFGNLLKSAVGKVKEAAQKKSKTVIQHS